MVNPWFPQLVGEGQGYETTHGSRSLLPLVLYGAKTLAWFTQAAPHSQWEMIQCGSCQGP